MLNVYIVKSVQMSFRKQHSTVVPAASKVVSLLLYRSSVHMNVWCSFLVTACGFWRGCRSFVSDVTFTLSPARYCKCFLGMRRTLQTEAGEP